MALPEVAQTISQLRTQMGQLGIGAMLARLGGNEESVKTFQAAIGKTITALSVSDEALHFTFDDGSKMRLYDDGQSCCEQRYMRTDDDLSYYVGAKLMNAEVRAAPSIPDQHGDEHDVEFLDVTTDRGVFQMANHNEHNGYYGGFAIRAAAE